MSNPNPPATRYRLLLIGLACLVLLSYGGFISWNFSSVAAGADSSGYLNSARLIASGRISSELRVPPEFGPQEKLFRQQFQPHGFAPFEGRAGLSPTYAVGLPLHLALAGTLFGWKLGALLVGVSSALAAIVLCYLVARSFGISPSLAIASAATLAAYPVLIYMSLQPLSDVLATAWCLAAVFAALRAGDHYGWAAACGAAFSIAVLVRATNALLLPALLVLLGWNPRRLVWAFIGGLPGAAWLGYYNHTLYGGALRSGYVNISDAFGWNYGVPTALHFIKWLALMLPTVLLPLAVLTLFTRTISLRFRFALFLWFGAFFGVYAFYEVSHEVWWSLRFVLPGVPPLLVAALLGLESLCHSARVRMAAASAVIVWAAVLGWYWPRKFHVYLTKQYERAYVDATQIVQRVCPPSSLILAGHQSGALYFYTSFPVLRFELVNRTEFENYRALATKAGRSIFALLYDSEERQALEEQCPGRWTRLESTQNVSLWRLDGPAQSASAR